jgi:broad specificity phosphatase PhoE
MKKIIFWMIRHGEAVNDKLTERGIEQVKKATKLFKGMTFQAAFYSGAERTRQTVKIVLSILNQNLTPEREEGFGYLWAEKKYPITPEIEQKIKQKTKNENETVKIWLDAWPGALLIRNRLLETLFTQTKILATQCKEEEINVLVGSHACTAELATLKPEETLILNYTDIFTYVFEYNENEKEKIKMIASFSPPRFLF